MNLTLVILVPESPASGRQFGAIIDSLSNDQLEALVKSLVPQIKRHAHHYYVQTLAQINATRSIFYPLIKG